MTAVHFRHQALDVACTLGEGDRQRRLAQWAAFAADATETESIDGGVRFWITPGAWDRAVALAGEEAECCRFLDIEIAPDGDRVRVDITSPAAGAEPVIRQMLAEGAGRAVTRPPGDGGG